MTRGSITMDVLLSLIISFIILDLLLNTLSLTVESEELINNRISEYEISNEETYRNQKECVEVCENIPAEE